MAATTNFSRRFHSEAHCSNHFGGSYVWRGCGGRRRLEDDQWLDLRLDGGAKHAGSGSECVKKCIEGGMTPVFVDESKKQVWTIDNPDAVKSYFGDHVTVKATANSDKKSVHIDSISAAK